MANFSEQATLTVVDNSSAQLKAINTALKNLAKTAASLKDATMNIKVNTSGLATAVTSVEKLYKGVSNFKKQPPLLVRADAHGLTQVSQQIAAIRQAAARPVNLNVNAAGGGAGARPPRAPGQHYGAAGGRGGFGAVLQGASSGAGLGIPLGAGPPGLMVLEAAAYAAAKALQKIGEAAVTRDRTNLQSAVQLTEAQRDQFKAIDTARKAVEKADPSKRPPLQMDDDTRTRLRTSLISDVGGEGATSRERQVSRANNAEILTNYLERDVFARTYAADPTKTAEQAAEGLRQLVQATNNATGSMVKNGRITDDALRVFRGIQDAQIADPDLKPQLIKSTIANLKSAGFSLSSEAITTTLLTASNQGQRAGNEVFRAIKALSGGVDVKMLNNTLAGTKDLKTGEMLLQDVKRNAKNNVIVNSGTAIDREMLQSNPAKWLDTYFKATLDKNVEEATVKLEKKGKKKGETDAQFRERMDYARSDEGQQAIRVAEISKAFPGANSAVINGINQMMLNYEQFKNSLEQAGDVRREGNVPEAIKKSWTAQWENMQAQARNKAAEVGDVAAQAMGLPDLIAKMGRAAADPTGPEAVSLAKTVAGTMASMANPLAIPAALLKTAGESLIDAAGEQQTAMGQVISWAAGKLGIEAFKPKTPEEKAKAKEEAAQTAAKAKRDAETKSALMAAATERKHTQDEIARIERKKEAARLYELTEKDPQKKAEAISAQNIYTQQIAKLNQALEANTAAAQSISDRAAAAEVAPAEVPLNLKWVDAAFAAIRKRAEQEAAAIKRGTPVKPLPQPAWDKPDTPENRKANVAAEKAARAEQARRDREANKRGEGTKWGDPKKPTTGADLFQTLDQAQRDFQPVINGLSTGAAAVKTSGEGLVTATTSMNTAGTAMGTAASYMDAAAGRINDAAGKLQNMTITINNNAGGPAKGETQPQTPN